MNFSKDLFVLFLLLEAFAFVLPPASATAAVSMPQMRPTTFNNRALTSVSPFSIASPLITGPSCDLAINKTVSPPSPVASGSTVTLKFTVTDVGGAACGTPGIASPPTTLTDNLPSGLLAFPPVTFPSGWTCVVQNGGAIVSCNTTNSFQVNQPVVITVQATVAGSGIITNCATVESSMDQNSGNNRSCVPISVTGGGTPCDLQITKTISPSSVASNSQTMVTLVIENVGQTTCGVGVTYPITVTDALPTGMTAFPPTAPSGWSCQTGSTITCTSTNPQSSTMLPNTQITITFPVTVVGNPGATLNNCATVSNVYDQNPANDQSCAQVTIAPPCSLSITKTASSSSVQVGQAITFTVTVTNNGGSACSVFGPAPQPTTVTDAVPPGFTNPSGSGSGWTCTTSGQTVNCQTIDPFNPGQSSTITITATATTAGLSQNCAQISNTNSAPQTSQSCTHVMIAAVGCAAIDGTGLVAWWPFDETSGTTVMDIVGGHNGGTMATVNSNPIGAVGGLGPATYPGKVGNSLLFTHYQYVNVPNDPALDPGAGDFTIDAWVFYVASGNAAIRPIVWKATSGVGATGYSLQIDDSGPTGWLEFGVMGSNGGAAISNYYQVQITPNVLHHVAATFHTSLTSSTILSLYLDGTLERTIHVSYLGPVSSSVDLQIGGAWPAGLLYSAATQVSVDDLELWNRALSPTQIHSIYAADSAGKCPTGITYVPEFPSGSPLIAVIGILLALAVIRPRKTRKKSGRDRNVIGVG